MATAVLTAPGQTLGFGYYVRVLRQEIRYEFLKMLRLRAFSLSVIGFPVMFYFLFGVANRHTDSRATCWRVTAASVWWALPFSDWARALPWSAYRDGWN